MDTQKEYTPEEKAKWLENKGIKVFEQSAAKMLNSVQNDSAVFLPTQESLNNVQNEHSKIKIRPNFVRRAIDGKALKGEAQLIALQELKDRNVDSNNKLNFDVITFDQAKKLGTYIKKNNNEIPKDIKIPVIREDGSAGMYSVFSANEVNNQKLLPQYRRRNFEAQTFQPKNGNLDEYLGNFLAASNQGGTFVVTPKVVNEFKANFQNEIAPQIEQGNYKALFDLGNKASDVAKEKISKLYGYDQKKENSLQNTQEKNMQNEPVKERKQSSGMSY